MLSTSPLNCFLDSDPIFTFLLVGIANPCDLGEVEFDTMISSVFAS